MFIVEMMMASLVVALWVFGFFIFDAIILNDYFKRKLQKRFKVEEVEE